MAGQNINAIYQHAPFTEAHITEGLNKDREAVIVTDFDVDSVISGGVDLVNTNYILAFEYTASPTRRRNLATYEGLKSSAGHPYAGASNVYIDETYTYKNVTGNAGWSVQKAIEDLDDSSGLVNLSDGPAEGSLYVNDDGGSAFVDTTPHQINLGDSASRITDSLDSTIAGGEHNIITSSMSAFIGSGEYNTISAGGDYGSVLGGTNNIVSSEYGSVIGGKYAVADSYNETVVNSMRKNANLDTQVSTFVLNGISESSISNTELFLDGVSERIKFPIDKFGGSLSGTLTITGQQNYNPSGASNDDVEVYTSQYIIAGAMTADGEWGNVESSHIASVYASANAGSLGLSLNGITLSVTGFNDLSVEVICNLDEKVTWCASLMLNKISSNVNNTDE